MYYGLCDIDRYTHLLIDSKINSKAPENTACQVRDLTPIAATCNDCKEKDKIIADLQEKIKKEGAEDPVYLQD